MIRSKKTGAFEKLVVFIRGSLLISSCVFSFLGSTKLINAESGSPDVQMESKEGTTSEVVSKPLPDPETQVRKVPNGGGDSPSYSYSTSGQSSSITLEQNMAEMIDFGQDISQVFVANPEIVDVQVNGPHSAYIFARKSGATTVFASDKEGRTIYRMNIRVIHNLKQLRKNIQGSFPKENIHLESTPNGIMVTGMVSNASVSKDIESLVNGYLTKEEKMTNALTIASPTQILLKVKIAEVNRETLNQFGINWAAVGNLDNFTYGILTGRAPIGGVDVNDAAAFPFIRSGNPGNGTARVNSYGFRFRDSNVNLNSLIDALDSETLATVLAEPNLMAVSGETASFLVGGEFPYPVPQQQNITIDFKEYGIRLSFTPTVRGSDKINLKVRPEVSELDRQNSVNIPIIGAGAVSVPGLKTRRAETSVELGNGQSLAIAGLISMGMRNNYNDIPGLADLPILGALFRSTNFQSGKSELVIIVTPVLVEPTSDPKALSLPTDNLRLASNLEMLLYRRLNRGSDRSVKEFDNMHLVGSAGFNSEEDAE